MAKQVRAKRADWIISRGEPVYAVAHAKATVRGDSTVDADLSRLEQTIASTGSFTVTTAVVNVDAWSEDEKTGGVCAVIPVTGMSDNAMPLIYVHPESADTTIHCGFESMCRAEAGIVRVYSKMIPRDAITLTILAMFAQSVEQEVQVSAPTVPTIAYYKLPVATADTLGGVKIGQNIEVTEDGTISAKGGGSCNHVLSGGAAGEGSHHQHDEDCMKDLLATTDEVEDALNRALGIDAEPQEGEEP